MFHLALIIWLSVAGIIVVLGALRARASVSARRECARLLPPENQLSWRMPSAGQRTLPTEWNISLSHQSEGGDNLTSEFVVHPEEARL